MTSDLLSVEVDMPDFTEEEAAAYQFPDADDDDDEKETSPDVVTILGFDPQTDPEFLEILEQMENDDDDESLQAEEEDEDEEVEEEE